MKKQFFFFFALLLAGMFSFQTVNAQGSHGIPATFTVPWYWQGKTMTGTTPMHGYAITITFTETQGKAGGKKVATMKIGNNEYKLAFHSQIPDDIFEEFENGNLTGRKITLEPGPGYNSQVVSFTRTNTDGVTVNSTTTLTIQ